MKRGIAERLAAAPRYPANCEVCGLHAATFTRPTAVVHYDCWLKTRRESSQNHTDNQAPPQ